MSPAKQWRSGQGTAACMWGGLQEGRTWQQTALLWTCTSLRCSLQWRRCLPLDVSPRAACAVPALHHPPRSLDGCRNLMGVVPGSDYGLRQTWPGDNAARTAYRALGSADGDIHAVTTVERAVALFIMLIGVLFFGYVISSLARLLEV